MLGYQAFYDRMVNKNKSKELDDNITSLHQKIEAYSENINKNKDNAEISELKQKLSELKSQLNNLCEAPNIDKNYIEKHSAITENANVKSQELFEAYKQEMNEAFKKAKEINDNIDKKSNSLDSPIDKLSGDNYITKLISDFNNYLSNLSLTDICLVINISSCLFILTCLVTILFSVYGNFIIDKFSLEQKYPKLAVIIKLRVKLQHAYV